MTPPNPYAPPKAEVADIAEGRVSPALWNPNAAANWSLLFSPIFGALLQMKNWQALGEPGKAAASRAWAWLSLAAIAALTVAAIFLPDSKTIDDLSRPIVFGLLIAWYFTSGRAQAAYVKSRYGSAYPRRGWARPLLFAVLALAGFFAAAMLVGVVAALFIPQA